MVKQQMCPHCHTPMLPADPEPISICGCTDHECTARSPGKWRFGCTLLNGHDGDHVAHTDWDNEIVAERWSQRLSIPMRGNLCDPTYLGLTPNNKRR